MKKRDYVLPAGIILLLGMASYFPISAAINTHNERMIEIGRQQMMNTHYEQEAERARKTRDEELRAALDEATAKAARDYEERKAQIEGNMTRGAVEKLIQKDPEYYTNRLCTIPDDMLAERNRIRENG